MTIGERIRMIRKEKKLTQKQLGELCNIAEPTIRRYELGGLNPKIQTIEKIAKALEVPISRFMNVEEWFVANTGLPNPPVITPQYIKESKEGQGQALITISKIITDLNEKGCTALVNYAYELAEQSEYQLFPGEIDIVEDD